MMQQASVVKASIFAKSDPVFQGTIIDSLDVIDPKQ
jgi:hypothetical protein